MDESAIRALFTRSDGTFLCARWGRPMVPVVFGVEDETLATLRGAFAAMAALTGRPLGAADPETGANLLIFFCRAWEELQGVPDLERLIEAPGSLTGRLQAAGANQYRGFRYDPAGAIRASFVLLRMDEHLSALPAGALALHQAVLSLLTWSDRAFAAASPVVERDGRAMLRPGLERLIRAAHAPELPDLAREPAHALRLLARMGT